MKKFAILSKMALCGIALSLGMTACDDELPNPAPAEHPELPVFDATSLVLAQQYADGQDLNLQTLADAGEKATIATIAEITDFPETFTLKFAVDLSGTADFADFTTFDATVDGDDITVPASTINDAIREVITKDPSQLTVYTRFAAYAVNGASTMRIGGADKYYAHYAYVVTPFTPENPIEGDWYLVTKPANGTFVASAAKAFSKAVAGSQYDNGVFTVKIDAEAGDEFMVLPASALEKGQDAWYGVAPSEDEYTKGVLVLGAAPYKFTSPSPYTIKIDVQSMTYTVSLAFEELWVMTQVPGLTKFDKALHLFTNDFVKYTGTVRLVNKWYLAAQPSTDGFFFTLGENGEQTTLEGSTITTGTLEQVTDYNTGNMNLANGLYYIEANLGAMTFKASLVQNICLIGEFNGWNTATAVELTQASSKTKFTLKDQVMPAGEYKFCVDHDWALSYGGAVNDIQQNAGDLTIEEAGTYDFELDFSKQPNTLKVTKK